MSGPIFKQGMLVFIDKDRAYELWAKGLCDRDIAEELGMNRGAIGEWRRRNRLKANPQPRTPHVPVKDRDQLSKDAYEARKAGMNYGMWKAQQFEAQKNAKASMGVRR